ncbi:MAG: hypothetical protein Kow0040_06270 [Thermogutta sp.]
MPTPSRDVRDLADRFDQNPHLVGPQAKLTASHVDDARVAGPKDANLAPPAQADLLQAMSGVAPRLKRDDDTAITGTKQIERHGFRAGSIDRGFRSM